MPSNFLRWGSFFAESVRDAALYVANAKVVAGDTDATAIAALTTAAFCQLLEAAMASKYLYDSSKTEAFKASVVNVAANGLFSLFRAGMFALAGHEAVMCQHFSGHVLMQLCKPPHNLLAIDNR